MEARCARENAEPRPDTRPPMSTVKEVFEHVKEHALESETPTDAKLYGRVRQGDCIKMAAVPIWKG